MRTHLLSFVIVGCLGGVLGWLAHSALQQPQTESSAPRTFVSPPRTDSSTEASPAAATPQPVTNPARTQAEAPNPQSTASATGFSKGADTSEKSQGNGFVAIPNIRDDVAQTSTSESAESKLPADLQRSMKLWCKYDPGNGAHLRDGFITKYDLAYQGGPVTFESIDIGAGIARMTGSPGATGSNEGILDVLASTTRAGLHFSAINSRGELVVTTVFGPVDKNGRHPSVMTTHGMHALNGSYQIYGSCDAS